MDYIIILKDGNPLTFGGVTIPYSKDERGTIVVYGDKDEAENDFNENEDLGIAQLEYSYVDKKCNTRVSFGGKTIGEFTHDTYGENAESDFQEKLWDFIILSDFVAYQLPH